MNKPLEQEIHKPSNALAFIDVFRNRGWWEKHYIASNASQIVELLWTSFDQSITHDTLNWVIDWVVGRRYKLFHPEWAGVKELIETRKAIDSQPKGFTQFCTQRDALLKAIDSAKKAPSGKKTKHLEAIADVISQILSTEVKID